MTKSKSRRQTRILTELDNTPSLRVSELARILEVSTETIRRDLDEMTDQRLLNRTYGGAIRPLSSEPAVSERHLLFQEERRRIARAALGLLRGARTLMIGSGSTTVHVARRIAVEMKDITVVTHAFGVATVLALNPTIRTIMVPGDYHAAEGATGGAHAVAFLNGFRADFAILGASGLAEDGPSEARLEAGAVYSAMAARAAETVVVADQSKFDRIFPSRYCAWPQVSHLVSDAVPSRPLLDELRDSAVKLTIA